MSGQDDVVVALTQKLLTLTPAMAIAWPNTHYNPAADVPFLSVAVLPGQTDNPTVGGGGNALKRYVGVFQVNVHSPADTGEGDARRVGDLLTALFPVGLSMSYNGVTVRVMRPVAMAQAFADGAWSVMPTSIFYQADIF